MNPSNPTINEVRSVERLFLAQMQRLTKHTSAPEAGWLNSFDFQCSDRWM